MLRAQQKKYAESEENDFKGKSRKDVAPVTRTRRALGDITNNVLPSTVADAAAKDDNRARAAPQLPPTRFVPEMVFEPRAPVFDEIKPVEMEERSYMQREADDIDSRDSENQLLCSTYVNDMYQHFWALERKMMVNASYMEDQPHINEKMRCILADWLIEVHLKFKLVPETLYLTLQIIDRYLAVVKVKRTHLQKVGVAALLLAAKYEEIYPPELHDLVYITDRAYTQKEILETESHIAEVLDYNLTVPTIHTFLCRYLKAAHADRTMVQMACYLAEKTLQEYSMIKFLPSVIAATAVQAARVTLRRHPWSPTLLKYTGYDECDLIECVNEFKLFMNVTTGPQSAVSRKYSSPKFGGVARMNISI